MYDSLTGEVRKGAAKNLFNNQSTSKKTFAETLQMTDRLQKTL